MPNHKIVCHVATMTQWGGVERMLVDFLTAAKKSTFSHALLTTSSSEIIMAPIKNAGITTFEPKRRIKYDPSAPLQMAQWLRSQKTSLVHTYNAVGNAYGNIAALLANIPIYITGERGSVWRSNSHLYWLNRLACQRANVVVANSHASKLMVSSRYRVHPDKIRVIHNFVAPPLAANREIARKKLGLDNEFVVGSIGRLAPQKGYDVYIEAAKHVMRAHTQARFILIGGGEQEESLREQARLAGIADKFIFTGWRSDARDILPAFDVFVSTSMFEPFGNVLVEAGMLAIPVIAPHVDGIPEIVEDKVTGRLIRPTKEPVSTSNLPVRVVIDGKLSRPLVVDPEVLASTILELASDTDLRTGYGEAAKHRVCERFVLNRYLAETDLLYTEKLETAK